MIVHPADRLIVKWAVDGGFSHAYAREYGLPDPCLRVHLGMSSAYFNEGQLVLWRAEADAKYLDQLMFELTRLFVFCAESDAYPPQRVFIGPGELSALHRPLNEAG
jgi:hypothetical protein